MTDCITLTGIRVDCIIGDLAWEREQRQPLRCDVQLFTDLRAAARSDRLADTIDYAAIGRQVVAFLQQSRYQMLEALAEGMATHILELFPAQRVALTIWKQAHFPSVDEVAVTIVRDRAQ